MVKCKNGEKDLSSFDWEKDFLLYNKCEDGTYCAGACATENTTCQVPVDVAATPATALPVDDMYILSFNKYKGAQDIITSVEDEKDQCEVVDIVLGDIIAEKKTFYLLTCIMFWVAFLLIVGTFVIALISVSQCGCCRCCNSVKSIFPMKSHNVSA